MTYFDIPWNDVRWHVLGVEISAPSELYNNL